MHDIDIMREAKGSQAKSLYPQQLMINTENT